MLGTGLQFGGVGVEDRFYIPVKARKSQNQQKQARRGKTDETENPCSNTKNELIACEPPVKPKTNLDRFLEATMPSVPAQYLSKTTMMGCRTCDIEFQPYFTLSDLWESFKEWSAYGAGVPLVLNGSDLVVQYYVPYLSGIQLHGESSMSSNAKPRRVGEDSDGDSYRDSSSDGSSDYEAQKNFKISRGHWGHHHPTNEDDSRMGRLSISDGRSTIQEGSSSDDGEAGNSRGALLFEFLEQDLPFLREPLADKIADLAYRYPGLKTLRSCDILPASWMSVAWYPIYRIPTGPTLKDLDACFLTYHSLSTPTRGNGNSQSPVVIYPSEIDGIAKVSLPVFGLASYKFKGSIWTQSGVSECQLASSLMQAADNWLRLLHVNQPDFQFFASHGMYWK